MAFTINGVPRIVTTGNVIAGGGITAGTLNDVPVAAEIVASNPSGQARLAVERPAGSHGLISLRTGQEERWQIDVSDAAESGGNIGSDLQIFRNDDDGNYIDTPFSISRQTGTIYLDNQVVVGNASAAVSQLQLSSDQNGSSEIVFVDEGSVSAYWQVDTNNDLKWVRYNPPGTSQGTGLLLDSSTGDVYVYTGLTVGSASSTADVIVNLQKDFTDNIYLRFLDESNIAQEIHVDTNEDLHFRRWYPAGTDLSENYLTLDASSGDILLGESGVNIYSDTHNWQNYGASSTVTGWSSRSYTNIYYKRLGDLVFCTFSISGDSDSTTTSFTLPEANTSVGFTHTFRSYDNGTYDVGVLEMGVSSTTCTLWRNPQKSTWSDTGTKAVFGSLFFIHPIQANYEMLYYHTSWINECKFKGDSL